MTPILLTPREYARLFAPVAEDAPKRKRQRRVRTLATIKTYCAVCELEVTDTQSGYHRQINGRWEHYHRECWYRGRP